MVTASRTDDAGHFEISIPGEPHRAGIKLRFVISAPAGQAVAEVLKEITESTNSLELSVDIKEDPPIKQELPTPVRKRRISGRVSDPAGRPVPPNCRPRSSIQAAFGVESDHAKALTWREAVAASLGARARGASTSDSRWCPLPLPAELPRMAELTGYHAPEFDAPGHLLAISAGSRDQFEGA